MSEQSLNYKKTLENGGHHQTRRLTKSYAWSGVFLLIIGLAFFMKNAGFISGRFNWWAFFILLPAIFFLNAATSSMQNSGYFSLSVRTSSAIGLISLTVAVMFLLNLDWSIWWSLMLIVPGFMIMINSISSRWQSGIQLTGLLSLCFWIGGNVMLLGVCFLISGLGLVDLYKLFGYFSWWGVFILLPGLGILFSAFLNYIKVERQATPENVSMLVIGLICCMVGTVAVLGLPWRLLTPLLLILAGILMLMKYYHDIKGVRA